MEQFRIVLSGNLVPGFDAANARNQLAKLLGKDEPYAAQFIAGNARTVKQGVDAATAVRYVTALRAIGIDCKFESETLDFDVDGRTRAPEGSSGIAGPDAASPSASTPNSAKNVGVPIVAEGETTKERSSILGIVAVGLGLASTIMPYFAAVFLVPAAFICGIIAFRQGKKGLGAASLILAFIGLIGIFSVSQKIDNARRDMETSLKDLERSQKDFEKTIRSLK